MTLKPEEITVGPFRGVSVAEGEEISVWI